MARPGDASAHGRLDLEEVVARRQARDRDSQVVVRRPGIGELRRVERLCFSRHDFVCCVDDGGLQLNRCQRIAPGGALVDSEERDQPIGMRELAAGGTTGNNGERKSLAAVSVPSVVRTTMFESDKGAFAKGVTYEKTLAVRAVPVRATRNSYSPGGRSRRDNASKRRSSVGEPGGHERSSD